MDWQKVLVQLGLNTVLGLVKKAKDYLSDKKEMNDKLEKFEGSLKSELPESEQREADKSFIK